MSGLSDTSFLGLASGPLGERERAETNFRELQPKLLSSFKMQDKVFQPDVCRGGLVLVMIGACSEASAPAGGGRPPKP